MSYNGNRNKFTNGRPHTRHFQPRGGRKVVSYDPELFIKKAAGHIQVEHEIIHKFTDFNIHPKLMGNIARKGFTTPTPIQDQAIPHILKGSDVVGIANTGTGKTGAFLIPLIHKVLNDSRQRVLIIAPTRELAVQVADDLRDLSAGTHIRSAICIGGVKINGQIGQLRQNPQFVVGTPGRLKDLENQRKLDFRSFDNIVLDEVDRMLDMGFIKDVSYIVSRLATQRHSLFFSATMPDSVQRIMSGFTRNPVQVSVKTQPTSDNIDQDIVKLAGREKLDVLDELLSRKDFQKVLIFGRTKHGIDKVQRNLRKRKVQAEVIHGNKTQNQRQKALDMFKKNRVQVLLATDIASRGLDISNVTHVINYDLPETYEDYVHRIGRTGRANQKGKALTFVD